MYNCEILADSLSLQGCRLTTMKITFPRFILAEFNTHRMFSRNSASSRAIPFNKMVKMVEENPFIPIAWQKSHKGMQGTEYFNEEYDKNELESWWIGARNKALSFAEELNKCGVTKQLCNRLLEPFMWHTVIVSATSWENFFKLRCPQYQSLDNTQPKGYIYDKSWKDYCKRHDYDSSIESNIIDRLNINKSQADIHIQAIAELMWDCYNESTPIQLQAGEWHIPFRDNFEKEKLTNLVLNEFQNTNKSKQKLFTETKIKIATARCARISYETLGDNPKIDYKADIRLHDMLVESCHWSPFEHVARVMDYDEYHYFVKNEEEIIPLDSAYGWCKNFRGFIQYRYLIDSN